MVVVILCLAVLCGIAYLVRWTRVRELSSSVLPDQEAEAITAELLEYVKSNSFNPNTEVPLKGFWKGRGYGDGDKHLILQPLFTTNMLLVVKEQGDLANQIVTKIVEWIFLPLSKMVVLNPQEWHRMTAGGMTVHQVVERQVIDRRKIRQTIKTKSGDVALGALQAGDASEAEVHHVGVIEQGVRPTQMIALAAALRQDSVAIDDEGRQAAVITLAEEVENAVDENRSGSFRSLVERATSYLALIAGGMESTHQALEAIKDVTGH